ncbi:MAG: hypothetical protein NTV74_08045, partial [Euryarchaeota archaeon]|nr:hypothetical protein [Euryarchaeota archaeon]
MRKTCYLISFLLICLLIFTTTGIKNVSAAGLQVTFTTNPIIAAPGAMGYIEVNLKGGDATSNIDISARSLDTNAVIAQGEWDVTVGSLNAGESTNILFKFRVPSTATPGLYQVRFEIGSAITQYAIVKVEDASVLDLASVTPTSINIGEATTLVFNITNNGGSSIDNILFTWEDPNDLILPIGADNRITISSIAAENHTEIPIVVMASSGISPGVYPLTITMDFYDRTGTKQTVTSKVGLQISGTTTFDLVLQSSTSGSTPVAVVNTGANVASSVIVSIPQQMSYVATGVSSASLGNLDAGDYTLATFQLSSVTRNTTTQNPSFNRSWTGGTPPSVDPSTRDTFMNRSFLGLGSNGLLVQISYTDVFGVRQTIQKQVTVSSVS